MKLPQLSLPWAIVASVTIAALAFLLFKNVVRWETLAAFVGGVLIPALRSSGDSKTIPPLPVLFFGTMFVCIFGFIVIACGGALQANEYKAQKKACVETSASRDELFKCWQEVDDKWNEAGAPPAAILDGGAQ